MAKSDSRNHTTLQEIGNTTIPKQSLSLKINGEDMTTVSMCTQIQATDHSVIFTPNKENMGTQLEDVENINADWAIGNNENSTTENETIPPTDPIDDNWVSTEGNWILIEPIGDNWIPINPIEDIWVPIEPIQEGTSENVSSTTTVQATNTSPKLIDLTTEPMEEEGRKEVNARIPDDFKIEPSVSH